MYIGGHQVKIKVTTLSCIKNFYFIEKYNKKMFLSNNIFISLKNAMKTIDTVALDFIYP